MTDLTDKLKKGELPEGFYYFKLPNGETDTGKDFGLAILLMCEDGDKIEVLSEVPSYEQWQAKLEENTKLKELLKECELWFSGIVGNMNDKNVGEHNRNLPIGNFEYAFKVFSQKINQALGEDK